MVSLKYATIINRKLRLGCYDFWFCTGRFGEYRMPEWLRHFDTTMQENARNIGMSSCHKSNADYLLKIVVRDHEHLNHFLVSGCCLFRY